jgi:hypothetical protein
LILELSRQLHAWREHLPTPLTWNDEAPEPNPFTDAPEGFDCKTVLIASLRTRYKYAQYLLWRPRLYKVLHFPNFITDEDLQGCMEAFKVSFSHLKYRMTEISARIADVE